MPSSRPLLAWSRRWRPACRRTPRLRARPPARSRRQRQVRTDSTRAPSPLRPPPPPGQRPPLSSRRLRQWRQRAVAHPPPPSQRAAFPLHRVRARALRRRWARRRRAALSSSPSPRRARRPIARRWLPQAWPSRLRRQLPRRHQRRQRLSSASARPRQRPRPRRRSLAWPRRRLARQRPRQLPRSRPLRLPHPHLRPRSSAQPRHRLVCLCRRLALRRRRRRPRVRLCLQLSRLAAWQPPPPARRRLLRAPCLTLLHRSPRRRPPQSRPRSHPLPPHRCSLPLASSSSAVHIHQHRPPYRTPRHRQQRPLSLLERLPLLAARWLPSPPLKVRHAPSATRRSPSRVTRCRLPALRRLSLASR
mmetsp:Transcript_17771/g.40716  ORF Transcript_17771/g.40716 Transcript_17771/m.40716 type:complete len:361 (-) Transcript_17771:1485-2567(-)